MENQKVYFPTETWGIYIIIPISIDRNYPCKSTIDTGNGKRDHQYFKSKQGSTDFIHIHEGFLFYFYPPSSSAQFLGGRKALFRKQDYYLGLSGLGHDWGDVQAPVASDRSKETVSIE